MNATILTTYFLIVPLFLIAMLAGVILLARWVYQDAKSRSMNPWPWVLLVLLVSPNFIGLIAYALARPKSPSNVACEQCGKSIPASSNYCLHCGARREDYYSETPHKAPRQRLLVTGFILLALGLIAMIAMIFAGFFAYGGVTESIGSYTVGSINMGDSDSWEMSFDTFQGEKSITLAAKSENPRLVYSSELTKGELDIQVFDGSDNLIATIPAGESGELTGLKPKGRYNIVVTAKKAGGRFEFKME